MAFVDVLLTEFDQEMKSTRAMLERVPMDRESWTPHSKSTALGPLASHLVNLAGFGAGIATLTEIDVAEPNSRRPDYHTVEALLAGFDANIAAAREAISKLTETDLTVPWTLKYGDHVIFTLPRAAVLRTLMMNHIIHHRGQLSVYLRLNEVPLPPIYGPTADS
jgi:uncharacterized damage-inducible protein DinB